MHFAKGSRFARAGAVAFLLTLTLACNTNLAVTTFAASTRRMSELLPRVAAVRFNACVELAIYEQLGTPSAALPKRDSAIASCHEQAAARDRFTKEFSVLTAYFTILGQLASGDRASAVASAKAIGATAGALAGANAAASGLAGAIADAVLQARTAAALKQAIGGADPHIQAYSLIFEQRIAPVFLAALQDQERELTALYTDGVRTTPASRLVLYRDFASELSAISASRDLVGRYAILLNGIAAAHGHLYANRSNLRSRETFAEIMRDSATIGGQLAAITASKN